MSPIERALSCTRLVLLLEPVRHIAPHGVPVIGLSGLCELFSAKWKFKMRKNTPKFFQKMQNITQNAGKIRSIAMATNMAAIFWTGKLVFLWLPVYRRSQTQRLSSEVPLMLRLSSFPRYVCLSPLSILASLAEKYQFRLNYAKSFLKNDPKFS